MSTISGACEPGPVNIEIRCLLPHTYIFVSLCSTIMGLSMFIWWRHQMDTFSALLALCAGNSPVTGEFPAQRPVTRDLMFSLICAWIEGWVNNREAGDLRRHRAHYDVTVMTSLVSSGSSSSESRLVSIMDTGRCKIGLGVAGGPAGGVVGGSSTVGDEGCLLKLWVLRDRRRVATNRGCRIKGGFLFFVSRWGWRCLLGLLGVDVRTRLLRNDTSAWRTSI